MEDEAGAEEEEKSVISDTKETRGSMNDPLMEDRVAMWNPFDFAVIYSSRVTKGFPERVETDATSERSLSTDRYPFGMDFTVENKSEMALLDVPSDWLEKIFLSKP